MSPAPGQFNGGREAPGGALGRIVRHAYEDAPTVRARFDRAGVNPDEIRSPEDLARIPVLRKAELTELQKGAPPFGGLLGLPVERLQRIFMSPGPIYDPQGPVEDFWRWGGGLRTAGFGPGDIVLNTFSYHLSPAGFMFDAAARSLGCVVVPAGVGNTELQARILADLGVTAYTGTPSFLMTLLEKARELGYETRKLTKAFVTAEMLPTSLRQRFAAEFEIEVYQGYGTADAGCVAHECGHREGMHVAGAGAIVEILDPETRGPAPPGEMGEIVVTVLDETYPLIRFGTGDLSAWMTEPCPCGSQALRLKGILGRLGDSVKVRGMFVHLKQVEEVMARFAEVARYQVTVTRKDHRDDLTFHLELAGEPANPMAVAARLEGLVRDVIRLRPEIDFVTRGTIPEGAKKLVDERKWD